MWFELECIMAINYQLLTVLNDRILLLYQITLKNNKIVKLIIAYKTSSISPLATGPQWKNSCTWHNAGFFIKHKNSIFFFWYLVFTSHPHKRL